MDADDTYRALTAALRSAEERADRTERELAALRARFDMLLDVLIARGQLAPGHPALLEKMGAKAARDLPRKVRLRVLVDKYDMEHADVDCAAIMPICHARCC